MASIRILAVGVLALGTAGCDRQQASPANPPGTAAERSLDRAAGTNVSGAYPMQSDGMPGNPPGTAAGRAVDRAVGTSGSR
jgi:hypothetical protein